MEYVGEATVKCMENAELGHGVVGVLFVFSVLFCFLFVFVLFFF